MVFFMDQTVFCNCIRVRYTYHRYIVSPVGQPDQARNQVYFRAGEVSENKGTSINI